MKKQILLTILAIIGIIALYVLNIYCLRLLFVEVINNEHEVLLYIYPFLTKGFTGMLL